MKIGFFDSGIGGLTVLREAIRQYPHAQYYYYADTAHVPYGKRSETKIKELVSASVDFLVNLEVDMIVLACNTATSVAVRDLRKKIDIPIVGMEPAVKPATELRSVKKKRIVVAATPTTLSAAKLDTLITDLEAKDRIDLLSLQKLVVFAEQSKFDTNVVRNYLSRKLSFISSKKYGSIVLGCTHFIYYKKLIAELLPSAVTIIDGNAGTVSRMLDLLPQPIPTIKLEVHYYESGEEKTLDKMYTYFNWLENQKK